MAAMPCGTVSMSVTQTAVPVSRRRRTSSSRFSSLLAMTRSGARSTMARTSGFLVPRTRGTSRSAGWVHHSVAPTRTDRSTDATASVSDGTRLTTRRAGPVRSTGAPRSSYNTCPTVRGVTPVRHPWRHALHRARDDRRRHRRGPDGRSWATQGQGRGTSMTRLEQFYVLDAVGGQVLPVLIALPDVTVEAGTRPTFTTAQVAAAVEATLGDGGGRLRRKALVAARTALVKHALADLPVRHDPDALTLATAESRECRPPVESEVSTAARWRSLLDHLRGDVGGRAARAPGRGRVSRPPVLGVGGLDSRSLALAARPPQRRRRWSSRPSPWARASVETSGRRGSEVSTAARWRSLLDHLT